MLQIIVGSVVVVALIYWAQGDGAPIAWFAGIVGLLIGVPLVAGVIRKVREAAVRRAEMDEIRAEAANYNELIRPPLLADLQEWRNRAEAARQTAFMALTRETRQARRDALERFAIRLEGIVSVDDPDPAFLPRVKLNVFDLVVCGEVGEAWETRIRYKLWLNRENGGDNELLLEVSLDEGREAVWSCLMDRIFRKPGNHGVDDVDRVAAELGLVPARDWHG